MAYIEYLSEEDTPEVLREMYKHHRYPDGKVSNIVHIQAIHPDLLMAHNHFFKTLMFDPSPLSRAQREMIGVVASAANDCPYWKTHHGAALRALCKDSDLVRQVSIDWREADLDDADRALCEYADKLTRTPAEMTGGDVDKLRSAGFDDRAVLDACNVVSYFNFVTRLAHGLGVDVEGFWKDDEIL